MRSAKFLIAGLLALAGVTGAAQQLRPPAVVEQPEQGGRTAGPPPQPQQQPAGSPALTTEDVNAWLDGMIPYALANGDVAGAVVVVVRDGRVLTQRGFGYADIATRRPVDPERTLFRPGSVSKLFTWTAVMQLVEQGRINLDADVNTYLDFQIPPRDGRPVTMRNIMTHTAGFEEQAKSILGRSRETVPRYGELLRRWVPERVFAPGTTPAYSNYATSLAGYIVERVSGMPFDTYIQRHVLAPIGMNNSSFEQPLPPRLRPMMSTGYDRASGRVIPFEYVGPSPAGSLSAPGADMARFMIAHLNQGAGLLRPETARMMHTTTLPILPHLNRMALGFYQSNINGRRVISHGGDTSAFHSDLHLFLDENVGIFISMNSGGRDGASLLIRNAFFEKFADRYFPAPRDARRVPAETAREHARMLSGTWVNSRGSRSSFFNVLELLGQVQVSVDAEGRPIVPVIPGYNGQPRQWVEVQPFLWQDLNSHDRLSAQIVDGQIVRFGLSSLPFMTFDRAPWHRNTALLMPLLLFSLAVLLLTVILWPVRALVRRKFGAKLELEGQARRAHLFTRLAALLILLTLFGWTFAIMTMAGDIENLSTAMDPIIWTLEIMSFIAFIGGFLVLAWSAWATWRAGRRWPAKAWSIALLLAAGIILWIGGAFNLLSLGVDY